MNLAPLKSDFEAKRQLWRDLVSTKFPGRGEWDWQRAVAAVRGENVRRNDDTSQDAAMAADVEIRAARLTAAAHKFGECNLYLGDDGEIYCD